VTTNKDTFRFVVPADMTKSADGSYKIRGLASTERVDQQGESIVQKGLDLTPIDKKKGILNWDHQAGPENTIGVLDGYERTAKGLVIEGRLFKNHTKAIAVREIMESLGEGDHGRVGLSVEGKILERDPLNPAIIRKCRISAVALTMNPVNTDTFADIVKSMNASDALEIDAREDAVPAVLSPDGMVSSPAAAEPTFTATQVMAIVHKALSIGAGATGAPDAKTGGDALQPSDMKADEPKKKKKKMKTMGKDMYKSNLITILDKLQVLYPDHSRAVIWNAVKERLDTSFEMAKGIRIHNSSGKEREHKLYEGARQRDDYEENKDKSRSELAQIAKESGADKGSKEKIRAQGDAAKQVGDRDHVRPNVAG
jgi:hypothetical protein